MLYQKVCREEHWGVVHWSQESRGWPLARWVPAAAAPPDPEHDEHRGLVEKTPTRVPGRGEAAYGQGETLIPLRDSPEMHGRTPAEEEY
ncbi:hypothetical protein NDU88_005390 [Pleurodeles waltl]|uniref:Uncharacterized protein n=1 Tax=Pleurodeles waltl TaxID=8319 RepID=A0AAV7QHQ3_PLEWA|nr:hypothetical protein NDU88_005390 [Pleurodeles waltl]